MNIISRNNLFIGVHVYPESVGSNNADFKWNEILLLHVQYFNENPTIFWKICSDRNVCHRQLQDYVQILVMFTSFNDTI